MTGGIISVTVERTKKQYQINSLNSEEHHHHHYVTTSLCHGL